MLLKVDGSRDTAGAAWQREGHSVVTCRKASCICMMLLTLPDSMNSFHSTRLILVHRSPKSHMAQSPGQHVLMHHNSQWNAEIDWPSDAMHNSQRNATVGLRCGYSNMKRCKHPMISCGRILTTGWLLWSEWWCYEWNQLCWWLGGGRTCACNMIMMLLTDIVMNELAAPQHVSGTTRFWTSIWNWLGPSSVKITETANGQTELSEICRRHLSAIICPNRTLVLSSCFR